MLKDFENFLLLFVVGGHQRLHAVPVIAKLFKGDLEGVKTLVRCLRGRRLSCKAVGELLQLLLHRLQRMLQQPDTFLQTRGLRWGWLAVERWKSRLIRATPSNRTR